MPHGGAVHNRLHFNLALSPSKLHDLCMRACEKIKGGQGKKSYIYIYIYIKNTLWSMHYVNWLVGLNLKHQRRGGF